MYDYMVRISKIGMDSIAEKVHEAVPRFLIEDCDDEDGSEYFHKTWSLPSGHGRWSVCHGQYGGYVTNASMETVWKDKSEMCPPSAPLGTMLGALIHLIEQKGKEHQAFLIHSGRPNRFISIPKVSDEVWDKVMSRRPKTLALSSLISN